MTDYVGDEQEVVDRQDLCPDCGRDMKALGMYRDYVHYVPGTTWACLGEPIGRDLREIIQRVYACPADVSR